MEVGQEGANLRQKIAPGIMAGRWGESSGYCLSGLQKTFEMGSHKSLLAISWVGWVNNEVSWKMDEWPDPEGGDQQQSLVGSQ